MTTHSIPYRVAFVCFRTTHVTLSRIGERLGWDWLIYNYGFFLDSNWWSGWLAIHFADALTRHFPQAKRIGDIGCGAGRYAAELKRRGLTVSACEYSSRGRRFARRNGVEVIPWDLSNPETPLPPGAPFDLAFSIEVAEHVPPALADALVQYCVRCALIVIITAAYPGQGGIGHINEQPKSYWVAKFASHGYAEDPERAKLMADSIRAVPGIAKYLWENLLVFRKGS